MAEQSRTQKMLEKEKRLEQGSFIPYLKAPQGVEFLKVSDEGIRELDFFAYQKKAAGGVWDAGELASYREYATHKVGPTGRRVICPQATFGLPCKMCNARAAVYRDQSLSKDAQKAKAAPFFTQARRLYNVVDVAQKDGKIRIFDFPESSFAKQLGTKLKAASAAMEDFDDPRNGKTLTVLFDMKTFPGGSCRIASNIEVGPRSTKYTKDILSQIVDLDTMLILLPDAEIWALFNGDSDPDADEPEDDDHEPDAMADEVDSWASTAVSTAVTANVESEEAAEPEPEPEPAKKPAKAAAPKPEPAKAKPAKAKAPPADDVDDAPWE